MIQYGYTTEMRDGGFDGMRRIYNSRIVALQSTFLLNCGYIFSRSTNRFIGGLTLKREGTYHTQSYSATQNFSCTSLVDLLFFYVLTVLHKGLNQKYEANVFMTRLSILSKLKRVQYIL